MLYDNHGREMTYLRLAVTDRCNLRCFYCMPEEGIHYMPEKQLLTWEEMMRIVQQLYFLGLRKIRITGGEPLIRQGLMEFLEELSRLDGLEICLTSNGVLLEKHIPQLAKLGVRSINLSLDSLDRKRFHQITRRDDFDVVYSTMMRLIEADFKVKINAVVMDGKNELDILALAQLTKQYPISVRFIEEMPFNGSGKGPAILKWDFIKIVDHLKAHFGDMQAINLSYGETALRYQIPGFKGDVGVIAAFSRTFCGTCNRIRLTAMGEVKTCLYDDGVFDLKAFLRQGVSDEDIRQTFITLFGNRPKDGFEAEKNRKGIINESMTSIGG
ncbi:GTP 3',8-cyclase MoaA [Aquirufa salirivi]|uniref:GTP 3',8-cyclase n=1 Tax=Aquirufa salirivi TaxID=3104729 RepID=A0ABW8RRD8_9BACT